MTSRKRYWESTGGSTPSPAPRASPERPSATPLSLFSVHQRERAASLTRQRQMASPAASVSTSMSAISSETRRMLRELERRSSPVNAGKKMRLDVCTSFASSYRSQESEMSSPSSSGGTKPPVFSLVTPYRAHVLPRLATLNKAPYARPVKQMVDVGVSTDLIPNNNTSSVMFSTHKSASKLKTVGGGRNKFAAFDLDQDEPEILYDNEDLSRFPRLPLHNAPSAGFLSSMVPPVQQPRRSSTPGSPTPDSFAFSDPIILASPPPSNQSGSLPNHLTNYEMADNLPSKTVTLPFMDGIVKTAAVPSKTALLPHTDIFAKTVPSTTVSGGSTATVNGPSAQKPFFLVNGDSAVAGRQVDKFELFSEKLTEPFKPTVDPNKWTCSTCYIKNRATDKKCIACDTEQIAAKPLQKPISANITDSHRWYCSTCFISNASNQTDCSACGSARPGQSKIGNEIKPQSSDFKLNKQDWSCTTCFISNPADKLKCVACQAAKSGSDFKSISFGFKPANAAPPTQSSTVGVQCVTLSDSPIAAPTSVPFGFPTTNFDASVKNTLATVNPIVATAAPPPTNFSFGSAAVSFVSKPIIAAPPTQPSTVSVCGAKLNDLPTAAPTSMVSFGFPTTNFDSSVKTTLPANAINPTVTTTATLPTAFSVGSTAVSFAANSARSSPAGVQPVKLNDLPTAAPTSAVSFGFPTRNFDSSIKNTFATVNPSGATAALPPTTTFSFGSAAGIPATTSCPAPSTGFSFSMVGPGSFAPQTTIASTASKSMFGFTTGDPTAAFAPTMGMGLGATPSAPQTSLAPSASQPTFGAWGGAPPATFSTIPSATVIPTFGQQPQMGLPVNMFNITAKSNVGGVPGRRTLTAKRKGK